MSPRTRRTVNGAVLVFVLVFALNAAVSGVGVGLLTATVAVPLYWLVLTYLRRREEKGGRS